MMDRDSSLEGRYSFPAAESTKLNHSNGSFRWGSTPISSSSTILESCVEDSLIGRSRCKNISKIDPRIVADVQSKGLASRIVKYHENGNRLNRSMSAHNLYSKPGHFPVVTLKKTDLPFRATKQNVSMTRIAPPEQSMFYGNTLSSLLRSSSVVGLQKSDEDISRENRPILHPPPTENDMAPTRSVLDVLKEISRKRINSDDTKTVDTSKKNRIGSDLLDAGVNSSISNISPDNVTMMANSFKRQRDVISNYKGEMVSPYKLQDTNKSPEQAKKRVCSYYNDITSSLSSSAKRKPSDYKRTSCPLNQTMPIYLESHVAQKVKMQKCHENNIHSDKTFDTLATDTDKHTSAMPSNHPTAYGVVPQRSKSEPLHKHEVAGSIQPRLTLFNKKYDVNNETSSNDIGNEDNLDESSECSGIHFVKPKKLTSSGLKNSVIERTQKSKLALMLSGLRGELYQGNDNDEVDTPEKKEIVKDNDSKQMTVHKENACVSSSNASANNINSTLDGAGLPNKTSSTEIALNPAFKKTSPLVGLKLTPQAVTPASNSTQNVDNSQRVSTPMLGGFQSNNISLLPTPVSSTVTSSASTNASPAKTIVTSSISFGTLTQTSTSNSVGTPNDKPAFNFGSTVAETNTKTNPAIATNNNLFAIGTSNIPKANADNSNSTNTAIAPVVVGLCDSNNPISSSSSGNSPAFSTTLTYANNPIVETKSAATSATTAPFSFGVSSNSQATTGNNFASAPNTQFTFSSSVATDKVQTSSPSANAFSFGSSTSKGNVPTSNTSTTSVSTGSLGSGFGATAFTQPSSVTTANLFGSSNLTTAPPVFGKNENKTTIRFGSEASNTPSVFGGSSVTDKAALSASFATKSSEKTSTANNSNIKSEGFAFGAESTKNLATPFAAKSADKTSSGNNSISSGGFAFGTESTKTLTSAFSFGATGSSSQSNTSNASVAPSNTFTFSSGISGGEKKSSANIFGGSTAPPESIASPAGFSFAAGTATGNIQKSSPAFSFGSSNTMSAAGHPPVSSNTGFSFAATTTANPKSTTSSKAFSFGTGSTNSSQALGVSNNNQTSSNMFAAPTATNGSNATFNFGASPATNTQTTNAQNTTNNIFAIPASMTAASGERPIRIATRRLHK